MNKDQFMKFQLFLLNRCHELSKDFRDANMRDTAAAIEWGRHDGRILELNHIMEEFNNIISKEV